MPEGWRWEAASPQGVVLDLPDELAVWLIEEGLAVPETRVLAAEYR